MKKKSLNAFVIILITTLPSYNIKHQTLKSTKFSTPESLVIQVCPEESDGTIEVNGKRSKQIVAYIFIPGKYGGSNAIPLIQFQQNCSIPLKYLIYDTFKSKMNLNGIDNLKEVIITKKNKLKEEKIQIPENISLKLFEYFKLDIVNNLDKYQGFDCYAFQSLLGNVDYAPISPAWDFNAKIPEVGDFIVLANNSIVDSIKHWAICLGDDMYLSKFGKSGEGTLAPVMTMNLEGMKVLYNCYNYYVVTPKKDSHIWIGYNLELFKKSNIKI